MAGTLTMVLSADPAGLDPAQLTGVQNWAEAVAVAAIYDQLFYPGAHGRLHAKIGTELTSEDGGATWTLRLRPGVRFSDGEPFDAGAVRANWTRIAGAERAPARAVAAMIAEMEARDDLTLALRLHAATPGFDLLVARSLATIASPRALEAGGATPVGAGPFLLAEWTRGERMRLVGNPDYWQPGKPYLDEIVVLTGIPGADDKFAAMDEGRAQVALEPMGGNIARYRAAPERFTLLSTPDAGGGVALALNVERPPFDDVRVRRALALTLDSAAFVEAAGYGVPGSVMTTIDRPGTPWHDPSLRLPEPDVAVAQELIGAVIAEHGGPIRFTVETFANEGHIKEAQAVKAIVEGRLSSVEVEVCVGTVAELAGKWQSGDYQACNYAVQWSEPALDLPSHFASNSPRNIMRYRSEAVDAALADLSAASDPAAAGQAHRRALRRVLDDVPLIWLAYKDAYHAVDGRRVRDWPLFYSLRPLIEDARLAE